MIVGALALIITIVMAGVVFERNMVAEAERMLQALQRVEVAILSSRFDEALILLSHVEGRWDRAGRIWPIVVDHHDMDQVSETLIRLRHYVRFEDVEGSMVELSAAAYAIGHVPKKESFSLETVF